MIYRRSGLFWMIIVVLGLPVSGQTLTSKTRALLEDFINQHTDHPDTGTIKSSFVSFLAQSEEKLSLPAEAVNWVLLADAVARQEEKINSQSTGYYKKALTLADDTHDIGLRAWVNTRCGFYFYSYNAYEKALPYFMATEELIKQFPEDKRQLLLVSEVYRKNAYFHGLLGDHLQSIEYLEKALENITANVPEHGAILFALGADHYKMGNIAAAKDYFQKTMISARAINDDVRYAKALGEMAVIYRDHQQYDTAIALLKEDIALSQKNNSQRNTMFAQLLLGSIYALQNNLGDAEKTLTEAANYAKTKTYLQGFEYEALEGMLKIAVSRKDTRRELELRRRLDEIRPEIIRTEGEEAIKRAYLEVQKVRLINGIEEEKEQREKQRFVKIAYGIIALLLGGLVAVLMVSHKRKLKARSGAYYRKVTSLQMEKLRSEKELAEKDNTLEAYKTYLNQKNQQITELEEEMKRFNSSSASYLEEKSGALYQLLESHLMTGDNWRQFRQAFMRERAGEYNELMEQYPGITEAGLRILLLQKMGLSNTEAAHILGVTVAAIKKGKQRLRKKYEDGETGG